MTDLTLPSAASSLRHPWLDALVREPGIQVRKLVEGRAEVYPFAKAEPTDAAASLLFGIRHDDPATEAFDRGCLDALKTLRDETLSAKGSEYDLHLVSLERLLAVIWRLRPVRTVADIHTRYAYWFGLFETAVVDRGLDLRREYWRTLSLTQEAMSGRTSRRLMSLWLSICAEAGEAGLYDESYLDVGLVGLRSLPLEAEHSSNEEAECHGLARWAVRQRPSKKVFLARWREIESAYPRSATYWPPLLNDVIANVDDSLNHDRRSDKVSDQELQSRFPAAEWWLEELELSKESRRSLSARIRSVEPPPREERIRLMAQLDAPIDSFRTSLTNFMTKHRRYADASGDTYHIVHSACNIGMRLLEKRPDEAVVRGNTAEDLARTAIEYESANLFAWGLWCNSLVAKKAFVDAESKSWEAIRRFPEDPQRRSMLARLLAQNLNRPQEAEHLLRDAILIFPQDRTLEAQLGRTLSDDLDRPDEAIEILRRAVAAHPDNFHTYTQLARLLSERGHQHEAIAVLEELQRLEPYSKYAEDLLPRLRSGERLRRARRRQVANVEQSAIVAGSMLGLDKTPGEARRALFCIEAGSQAMRDEGIKNIKKLVSENPGSAFVRFAAERTRVGAASWSDMAFPFEFDRALRAGSVEDLGRLVTHSSGLDRQLAKAGLSIIEGGRVIDVSGLEEKAEPGAARQRLTELAARSATALASAKDTRPFLRLLSDFSASELSIDLAA